MDNITNKLLYLIEKAKKQYSEEYLVLAIPNFISRNFIAYCAMKDDLELILQYIGEVRNDLAGVIKSALSYSIIALYGKCFTDASKSNSPKLEPKDLASAGDANYATHNYLMKLRHQFIAHRGETENEIGISYLLIPKKGSLDKMQVRFSQLKMVGFSNEDLDKIESLVKFVIEILMAKIHKSGQKVHNGMLKLFTLEELKFMLMNGAK